MRDEVYLNPADSRQFGSVIKVDDACYINTGKTGTMTHYISGGAPLGILDADGKCSCLTPQQQSPITEKDTTDNEDYIYLTPFSQVPEGKVIKIDGRCYVKTGETGTMTHFISSAPTWTDTCSACDSDLEDSWPD